MFPAARVSARPSLAPLIIFLASLLLAGLLALLSWRNFQHEEKLRERVLIQQGTTLIRSFEAGARTGMMMRWREDALKTLLDETIRETEVAYIAIVDVQGNVQAVGGSWVKGMVLPLAAVRKAGKLLTRTTSDSTGKSVYEVSRMLRPYRGIRSHNSRMMDMMRDGRGMMGRPRSTEEQKKKARLEPPRQQAIFVGIYFGEFEQARIDSLRQNLLLGGLLLLVGSAGFYLLFLSQRNRVTRTTLETMEIYAASLIEGMPAGLLSLDAGQRVLAVNTKTLEMLGQSQNKILGVLLSDLLEESQLAQMLAEEGSFIEKPFTMRSADGNPLPLRISASRLNDSNGVLIGTVLILRDMRELQAMEDQLERSRRHSALGVMATGVAHEIRNPLGTLRGFAQYFQRSSSDTKAREYAGLMISEVDRLNRVISALLQFSKPRNIEKATLNSVMLCERVKALMNAEAAARQVELQVDCSGAPDSFIADFDLLLQMLLNLLQNALEASSKGGLISLLITGQDDMIEMKVSDTGRGIDPETRQTIFDPFFTTRKSGTGLGLAIVSQIVEQHGGQIGVESTPASGTTFSIRLPQRGKE